MEGHTRTSSITRPYTAANAYHRPRPRPSLDHSSSAPCSVSQTTEKPARQAPVNQLGQAVNTAAEPLPSRPANHIQQHHSAPRLNQAPLLRPSHSSPDAQYRIYSPEEEEEVHTTTEVLLDDVERLARPALTSKFSFDNLTAMDTSNGGALKRMATRAWLQSIAQAARNSTISSSTNAFPSVNAAPHPNTRPGTPIEQYNISSSPTLAVKAQTSFLNFRSRGGDKEQTASRTRPSRCASPSIPKNSCKWTNPRKEKNEDGLETMIIGNPELVHPSTGDTVINNHLGQGARRVGLPAEAFGMSPTTASHRVYLPPTSPLPRTSEDSVRSRESTTSTALSLFSDCTSTSAISKTSSTLQSISSGSDSIVRRNTRQDRALPYLPLRIKNLDEGRKTSDGQRDSSNLLTAADDVEQLVLTPSSPPESAKHIFNSLYPEAKSIHGHGDPQLSRCNRLKDTCPEDAYDVEETVDSIKSSTARRSLDKSPILASSSPGASQILSRNATHSINHSATVSKSPASPPAFVDVSPLKASQKLTGETHVLQTRPTRSSSLSNASCSGDMVQDAHKGPTGRARTPAVSSAFRALMLQPVPVFPTGLSDEEKLVNLHVGGSKVYTTRLSAITSHQDSNLAVFINTHLQTVGKAAGATSTEGENNEESVQTINDESNELRPSSEVKRDQPRMAEALSLPASVALHSPTSPIHAIRSARASIYDDILSDQGEEDEKNDIDISIPGTLQEPLFGICKSVDSFRGKLGVSPFSFPDPRKGGMRFTRFTTASSSSTSVSNMDGHATGPSSDCEGSTDSGRVSQGEGETLNFIDTTPDNEPDNPFHLQEEVTSAAPSVSSQQGRVIASKADKSKASLDTEESRYSSNSIPSLSSSNNSSDHSQIDSPILTSKSVAAPQLTGSSAFEQIVSQHQQYLWLPVNVYIDRSAQPYDGLLHWLRTGSLPSRLCLDEALSLATADGTAESHQSIRAVLDMIPTEAKQKLMPLVLHPIMSEVKDLRDEAEYLGFYKLVKQCEAEIAKLKRAIRFSRNVVGHPGMHVRSESEGGTAASPAKLTGRLANRPRPRLVGHRHYDSESKTMPREMKTQAQDNWI